MKTDQQIQVRIVALIALLLWNTIPTIGWAQAGLKVNATSAKTSATDMKMSANDLSKAVNTPVTADGMDKVVQSLGLGAQAINNPVGKYGIKFDNTSIHDVYTKLLEQNIDVMISTLNDKYPLRKTIIDQLIAIAGSLTYEYHMAVGTQTGQPKSMSQAGRDNFTKSITQALNLDFYTDDFTPPATDAQLSFLVNKLQMAVSASGEGYIAQYPANMAYMSAPGSDPTRGTDRIRDTAKDCLSYVTKTLQTSAIGSTIASTGAAMPADLNQLLKTFNRIKGNYYWQTAKPNSIFGFYLKQLPGATLASDVTGKDGVGDRYVDKYALDNGLAPFPSSFALSITKAAGDSFAGVGVVTVPDPSKISIDTGNSSGSNNSSNGKKSNDPPAAPVVIH